MLVQIKGGKNMKVSGKCPKCSSSEIKENTMGGMGNMMAGRVYRCRNCGFSEIWQTKSDERNLLLLYLFVLLIPVAGLVWFMMFK